MVQTILRRYAVVATRNVLRGHRMKLGNLLTFYPQLSTSVKDEVDKDGKVTKVATADMLPQLKRREQMDNCWNIRIFA